jgi:hypothetical protein
MVRRGGPAGGDGRKKKRHRQNRQITDSRTDRTTVAHTTLGGSCTRGHATSQQALLKLNKNMKEDNQF